MKKALSLAGVACALALSLAVAQAAQSGKAGEPELQRLESAKWNPSALSSPEALKALIAEDFVSVEYGTNLEGVTRKTRAEVLLGPPLPPASFELSDWKFIHAGADTVIVSYRVNGLSFKWKAYATSVWARRGGKWVTVFYQASTAL